MSDLALLTDFYQLTMMQGYFQEGSHEKKAVFEMFYRENPGGSGFAIMAGLASLIKYIDNLTFTDSDIKYLWEQNLFSEEFIEYLQDFSFTGDILAIPEGSVIFPGEPLIVVCAPIIQAQLIETALLNFINHQSLIATKAARVCYAAAGDVVLEFGLRRAQGRDAGVLGARAAMIGGCTATSNVLAGKIFGLPTAGTHSHSWIMSFDSEIDAFRAYARAFPLRCTLLADTYDTLNQGVPNAIKVFDEMGFANNSAAYYGIRLDSGDFAYLSKQARFMLDAAGHEGAKITASCDLDEVLIQSLKIQGARIDNWGVGTSLITSKDCPAFGGVYKLAAVEGQGGMVPKLKLSENPEKVTNPGEKRVVRIYDAQHHKIKADLIVLADEIVDLDQMLTLFDPKAPWKKMVLAPGSFYAKELLVPIYKGGRRVYDPPEVAEIRAYCQKEQSTLWDEYRRLINPHIMPVDLSQRLYNLKNAMIYELREKNEE